MRNINARISDNPWRNIEEDPVKYKKLHKYFIEEPLVKKVNSKHDLEGLLNWCMGAEFIDEGFHSDEIFEFVKKVYEYKKSSNDNDGNGYLGFFGNFSRQINYTGLLEDLIIY